MMLGNAGHAVDRLRTMQCTLFLGLPLKQSRKTTTAWSCCRTRCLLGHMQPLQSRVMTAEGQHPVPPSLFPHLPCLAGPRCRRALPASASRPSSPTATCPRRPRGRQRRLPSHLLAPPHPRSRPWGRLDDVEGKGFNRQRGHVLTHGGLPAGAGAEHHLALEGGVGEAVGVAHTAGGGAGVERGGARGGVEGRSGVKDEVDKIRVEGAGFTD